MSFEILDARYGPDGSDKDLKDVTDLVKQKVSSDRQSISFTVSPSNIGISDPAPGNKKVLLVRYSLNSQEHSDRVKDGDTFAVSVPKEAPKTPSQYISSFYGALWSNFAGALSWFITAAGFAFAWELGRYFGNSYVWIIIAIIVPNASYWLIPVVVLLTRAVGGEDVIRPFAAVM